MNRLRLQISTSVKSLFVKSKSELELEDFRVPYGVRELRTQFNLKEYPDSLLDLEFDPRTAPQFP